jgi:hypothetical protein
MISRKLECDNNKIGLDSVRYQSGRRSSRCLSLASELSTVKESLAGIMSLMRERAWVTEDFWLLFSSGMD